MTPERIRALRHRLGENTTVFGGRFLRSHRTIEDWEQGRRHPDPLALLLLRTLDEAQSERRLHDGQKNDERRRGGRRRGRRG